MQTSHRHHHRRNCFRRLAPRRFETLEHREYFCAHGVVDCDISPEPEIVTANLAEPPLSLDLNGDQVIDRKDIAYLYDENQQLIDTALRDLILAGDSNLDGRVDFIDFLTMASYFGSGESFGQGDFDWSGAVDFGDFLLMSSNFGRSREYRLPTVPAVPDPPIQPPTDPPQHVGFPECLPQDVVCVFPGDELAFQTELATPSTEGTVFYVQPGVLLDGLHVFDRHGDEIHFLQGSTVTGTVQATGPWNADRGLVNIEASSDLLITGLHATNEYQYQLANVNGDQQSSTALNISWSHEIELRDSVLIGNGKLTTWIQGNSRVTLTDTEIDCYYFCVGVAASNVSSQRLVVHQNNQLLAGDRHAAMWVSSTMRAPDNTFYGSSTVSFRDTEIHRQTGEGIVVGNGGYAYRSNVRFLGNTTLHSSGQTATRADGWLAVHPNYFGISLYLEGDYPATETNFAVNSQQFGRYVMHAFEGTGAGPEESPLVVCQSGVCVSTNQLF